MDTDVPAILISGLAGFRLAALLSYETGPFRVFERVRQQLAGVEHDPDDGHWVSWRVGVWSELLQCVWCLSLWAGAASWGLYQWEPWGRAVVAVAATASVIGLVHRYVNSRP